jgi:hypothetical protein
MGYLLSFISILKCVKGGRIGLKAKGLEFNFQKGLRTFSVPHSILIDSRAHPAIIH